MIKRKMAYQIQEYFTARCDEMEAMVKTLANFETPSRNSDAQTDIIEFLIEKFRNVGYTAIHVPGKLTGGYLYLRPIARQTHKPVQLLVGHCDTVWPLGTIASMPVANENGTLKGPGVFDMKAGITQMYFCLKAIHDMALNPEVVPVILINSDEEIGSHESTTAIRRLAKIAQRAYILEPPLGLDGKLKTARKGIGKYTLKVCGVSAHAGLDPGKGASAIIELSHQIQKLFEMNDFSRGITVNVGMIEGGISPNVIAPESKAVIDVRVLTKSDAEWIEEQIMALQPENPETEISVSGHFGRPPLEKNARNNALWAAAETQGEIIGLHLKESVAGGGSDGNTTSLYCATLDGLGTVGDGAHAEHEFIFLDKLVERTTLLTLLVTMPPMSKNNN